MIEWIFWGKAALKLALSFAVLPEVFSFIAELDSNWCLRVSWKKVLGTFLDCLYGMAASSCDTL